MHGVIDKKVVVTYTQKPLYLFFFLSLTHTHRTQTQYRNKYFYTNTDLLSQTICKQNVREGSVGWSGEGSWHDESREKRGREHVVQQVKRGTRSSSVVAASSQLGE